MTIETKTTSTVGAFTRIVKALKTVSAGKRPALLDLAMREAAEVDCPCQGATYNPAPPAPVDTEQKSLL